MVFENTYDIWWIPICILFGLGVATLSYYRTRLPVSGILRWVLFVLRAVGVSLLCFLLLEPFIRIEKENALPSRVVVLYDDSRSMLATKDSSGTRTFLNDLRSSLESEIGDEAEVDAYYFGESLLDRDSARYDREATDFQSALSSIRSLYRGEAPAGVILVSDGILNRGIDPRLDQGELSYPLFTIGTGDTAVYPDLSVARVDLNRRAFLGNTFPLKVTLRATGIRGERNDLEVRVDGKLVERVPISFSHDPYVRTYTFQLKADSPGRKKVELITRSLDGEENTANNRRTAYIDVVEQQKKIHLIYEFPHADVAAIQRALKDDRSIDLEITALQEVRALDADLVILHGRGRRMQELWKDFPNGLAWIMPEGEVDPRSIQSGKEINREEIQASVNSGFGYFDLNESQVEFFNDLPPLKSAVNPIPVEGGEVLFRKKVGKVVLPSPLVWYGSVSDHRRMAIHGLGIWRWRMEDYRSYSNFQFFDSWITASVDYLTQDPRKERFRVDAPRDVSAGQNLTWRATVLNQALRTTISADVKITLTGPSGEERSYSFLPSGDSYQLSLDGLEPGTWSWKATAVLGDERLTDAGALTIEERQVEVANLVADHALLRQLSDQNNGEFYKEGDPSEIAGDIVDRMDLRPIKRVQERLDPLIKWFALWILVFLILGAEWFLRRWNGSY